MSSEGPASFVGVAGAESLPAAAALTLPALSLLEEFCEQPAFRRHWRELTDPALLDSPMAPAVAAIIAWRRSQAQRPSVEAQLAGLEEVLAGAAARYDHVRADLRSLRFAPLMLAAVVAGADSQEHATADRLTRIGQSLMAGFWSLLGESHTDGRWCGCYGTAGPVWVSGPADPADRRRLLLAAYRAGVPAYTLSPALARRFPAEAQRWIPLTPQALLDLFSEAGLHPDPRLALAARRGWQASDLPDRLQVIALADSGLRRVYLDTPTPLRAPIEAQPLALPWLIETDTGLLTGSLVIPDQEPVGRAWADAETQSPPLNDSRRRVLQYAGEPVADRAGYDDALAVLLSCLAHDLATADSVLNATEDPDERNPDLVRSARRQLRRERLAGRGPRHLDLDPVRASPHSALTRLRRPS